MKYVREICVAECAEMDVRELHCVEEREGYCHRFFEEHGCCPVGNIPKWKPFD